MENDTIIKKLKPIFEKWKKDYSFKTMANSALSAMVTILFALYNGFLGIHLFSVWHGSICVFYLLLSIIRGTVLLTEKNNMTRKENEKKYHRQRTFRISAAMLLVLNLTLIVPVSLMAMLEKPVRIGLIPAIAMAAYTTCKITMASIHIQKQKRNHHSNPLVTELRIINFIDALVSVLTLQNTLIMVEQTEVGADDMSALSAASSAVIYIVIMIITVHLLITGFKQSKSRLLFSDKL